VSDFPDDAFGCLCSQTQVRSGYRRPERGRERERGVLGSSDGVECSASLSPTFDSDACCSRKECEAGDDVAGEPCVQIRLQQVPKEEELHAGRCCDQVSGELESS
jgi:hypothetical protein